MERLPFNPLHCFSRSHRIAHYQYGANAIWNLTNYFQGPRRDLDHLAGPRTVPFSGLRFRVDSEQQFISWMGWEFYLGFDRDMVRLSSLWSVSER